MGFRRISPRATGLLIAALFAAVGLATLGDYGLTWDELKTMRAGEENLVMLRSLFGVASEASLALALPPARSHELPGYYFVFDTARAAFATLLVAEWRLLDVARAYHLFHLLLASWSLYLLHSLAFFLARDPRVAALAALSMALLPLFVAHSQNNPKDLIGLFVFLGAITSLVRLTESRRWPRVAMCGLVLGLAFSTSVLSWIAVLVVAGWALRMRGYLGEGQLYVRYGVALLIGFLALVAFWPWLWANPIGRLWWAFAHLSEVETGFPSLYLGAFYPSSATPWHYGLVNFLVRVPVIFLLFVLSILCLRRGASGAGGRASLVTLGAAWFLLPLLVEALAPHHYDGARHLLMVIPGFCLLVAAGVAIVLDESARRGPFFARAAVLIMIVAYAQVFVSLVRVHPYSSAYLNEVANALIPGAAEDYLEVEYWGHSYKEGANWLVDHMEGDAEVIVPVATQVAEYYLGDRVQKGWLDLFRDQGKPRYLMLMTRLGGLIHEVEREHQPVFTIRRQKGTLLKIFKNRPN